MLGQVDWIITALRSIGLRNGWRFDFLSSIATIVIFPLLVLLLRIIARNSRAWVTLAVDGVLYWVGRSITHSLASAFSLSRYCRLQLQNDSQFLYVPSRLDTKLEVDRVFVTLTLDHYGTEKRGYTETDVLLTGPRMRIIGDPGSGKSSLVKRLLRDACRSSVVSPRRGRLPILIELKSLSIPGNIGEKALGNWLYNHLRATVAKTAVFKMAECFDAYAVQSGILVLFDGLDEVPRNRYPRVQMALESFSTKLANLGENNTIVVTMRTQFHHEIKEAFRESFGPALFIRPFTPSDIYDFLTRWPFSSQVEESIERIYKDLTDRPTLREMCTNPLVLAMFVADYQSSSLHTAPETRTEFYKRVTDELLIRRRLHQTGPTRAAGALREQRERILGRLAFDHMLNPQQPANSLKWSDAMKIVKEVTKCNSEQAAEFFLDLAKETGLVSEERPRESFRFIHLTFCEFLAALEATQGQKDGWNRLVQRHSESQSANDPPTRARLMEVVPFGLGLVPRVRRTDAIQQVSALDDFRLLGRCFLEIKSYDHDCWPSFIGNTRNKLLGTPEAAWDENWLRDLHLFNVVVRDASQCAEYIGVSAQTIDLASFYRTLVERQQNSLASILAAYASQDAAAAFRVAEICGVDLASDFPHLVVQSCDQPPFLGLAVQKARSGSHEISTWAPLIVEAALRSRVVALALQSIPPDQGMLQQYLKDKGKAPKWTQPVFLEKSLYTQLISAATSVLPRSWPMLGIVAEIPEPGRIGFQWLACRAPVFFLFWALFLLPVWASSRRHLMHGPQPNPAWIFVFLSFIYYGFFRWLCLMRFYRTIINLWTEGPLGNQAVRFLFRPWSAFESSSERRWLT